MVYDILTDSELIFTKFTGFVDIRLWKHPIDYGCDQLQAPLMAAILLQCQLVAFGG